MEPFIAIGAEELGEEIGEQVTCPNCKELHDVKYGTNAKTGEQSKMLAYVTCTNGSSYLVGIDGKVIS